MMTLERIVREHGVFRGCKYFRMVGPQWESEGLTEMESEEVGWSQIAEGLYAMLREWTFILKVTKE